MITFLRLNARWLAPGFLMTFASAFGQTWFIALFAGDIRAAYGLSDGAWGGLYTVATLAAAGLLFARGGLADTMPLPRLAATVALGFAAAALAMAFGGSLVVLGLAVFVLRFCGQGMFSHIAMTAMGRWFVAQRGRAVSIVTLGHAAGEMVLPILTVALIGAIGWRASWVVVAAVLALAVAPVAAVLFARGRLPRGALDAGGTAAGLGGRHWTRREALRHWLLPTLLPFVLTPGFIGTVVYFHQVHIAEVKGWTLAEMARGYPVYAAATILATLAAGRACDRLGPARLLPGLLVPMAAGVALLGPGETVAAWIVALGLLGITQGISAALWGALLPALYGTRNLGSVRSLVTTAMVFSTAIGPGITGFLIDLGVSFPRQSLSLGLWCLTLSIAAVMIERRIAAEARAAPGARP